MIGRGGFVFFLRGLLRKDELNEDIELIIASYQPQVPQPFLLIFFFFVVVFFVFLTAFFFAFFAM